MGKSGRNGEVMPTATSRGRVVRTGTSSREHEHMHARRLGAPDKIKADGMIVARATIELEPQHVGRDLGRLLDGHAANQAEHIRYMRALRGGCEILVGTGPYDRGTAHGRDADRCRVAPSEQFDADRRQGRSHAITRHDLHRIERAPVAGDAIVGTRAAIQYSKAKCGTCRRACRRR